MNKKLVHLVDCNALCTNYCHQNMHVLRNWTFFPYRNFSKKWSSIVFLFSPFCHVQRFALLIIDNFTIEIIQLSQPSSWICFAGKELDWSRGKLIKRMILLLCLGLIYIVWRVKIFLFQSFRLGSSSETEWPQA